MDRHSTSEAGRVVIAAAFLLILSAVQAWAQPMAISRGGLPSVKAGEIIVGIASFYDTPGETASGEQYDPTIFTAAAQLDLRDKFGGIGFGKNYQPTYAVAEYAGKRAILKFNDVGPLRPGRAFDLSRAAMAHFGGLELGLLPDFKVVLLPPGRDYTPGPLTDDASAVMEANNVPPASTVTEANNVPPASTITEVINGPSASVVTDASNEPSAPIATEASNEPPEAAVDRALLVVARSDLDDAMCGH